MASRFCDACRQGILRGPLYRCVSCADVDLCPTCCEAVEQGRFDQQGAELQRLAALGHGGHHPLLRIPSLDAYAQLPHGVLANRGSVSAPQTPPCSSCNGAMCACFYQPSLLCATLLTRSHFLPHSPHRRLECPVWRLPQHIL